MTLSSHAAIIAGIFVDVFERLKEHGKVSPAEQQMLAETCAAHLRAAFPMTIACSHCMAVKEVKDE